LHYSACYKRADNNPDLATVHLSKKEKRGKRKRKRISIPSIPNRPEPIAFLQ
jgi:hypothetical protein